MWIIYEWRDITTLWVVHYRGAINDIHYELTVSTSLIWQLMRKPEYVSTATWSTADILIIKDELWSKDSIRAVQSIGNE